MSTYYLTLGYPLAGDISGNSGYTIEISSGVTTKIPYELSIIWASLLNSGLSDEKTAIEKLAGRGLLIAGNTKKELLTYCMKYRTIRQGIGSVSKQTDGNNKTIVTSVRLGDKDFILSEFQSAFWYNSDSVRNISEILNIVAKKKITNFVFDEEIIAEQIFKLIENGLIFIEK